MDEAKLERLYRALLVERDPSRLGELARQLNTALEERIRALGANEETGPDVKPHP